MELFHLFFSLQSLYNFNEEIIVAITKYYKGFMSNLRLQIVFKPSHLLTTVGSNIHILPVSSYLRILNSIELIKVNTSNTEPLKIGQSFYIYFYFSQQYLVYDPLLKLLKLSTSPAERSSFKILTDKFDWNSRGQIDLGLNFKYRIILAEHNSMVLANYHGQLAPLMKEDQNSLVSFIASIYTQDSHSYPIKLVSLQNNHVLCYKNNKTCAEKMASICHEMISLQKKENSSLIAIKHLDSNSFLVRSGKQLVFMKDAPSQLKFCLKVVSYDSKGNYLVLQTQDNKYLNLNPKTNKCELSEDTLDSILVKKDCSEQSIKNILVSAWLKAELPLQPDQENIAFILEECEKCFQEFSEVYEQRVVEGLITQGLFYDLDYINEKYSWDLVGPRIINIVKLMLKIKKSWVSSLFNTPSLYEKLMQQHQINEIINNIRISKEQLKNPHQVLNDVKSLIAKQQSISLTTLKTLLIVSPLIYTLGNSEQYREIKQFVDFACSQIVPSLKKQSLSSFFSIGLKIVKANVSPIIFNTQVMSNLSLKLLESQNLNLEDKLILIQKFEEETGPYVYIVTQEQSIRSIAHERKHQKTVSMFIEDILPKNCRFQTYENKIISIFLIPFHLKVNHILELNDCKEYMKYLLESIISYNYEQKSQLFLKVSLRSSFDIINRIFILVCEKSLQYDSITNQENQRILKCKKQTETFINQQTLNLPVVWNIFEPDKQLSQNQEEIFIYAIKISERVMFPEKYIHKNFHIMKIIDQPSPYLIKSLSLFLQREHSFNPVQASEKLIEQCKDMEEDEYRIIVILIHENDMYDKLCHKSEAFYKVINKFATIKIMESQILDGERILKIVEKRRNSWLYTDHEFNFLRNLLLMIGGVVSTEIYQIYEKYICSVQPDKWSLHFFRFCRTYFMMNPVVLKKRFVVDYHSEIKSSKEEFKFQRLFFEKSPQFAISYLNLLLAFADFHSSKQLIYEIMGDQILFNMLYEFHMNLQLRVKVLELMIKARKRFNEYETLSASLENITWLKKGTTFIRQKLSGSNNTLMKTDDLAYLKEYTCVLLDFLQMREQITLHTEISEDEAMDVEGTNKIFAFKLAELIDSMVKNEKIQKPILDKIQWFENHYKIGIDTIELTQISVDLQKQQKKNENFEYNYMLTIKPEIGPTVEAILTKISLPVFVTTLIKIILTISIQSSPSWQNLELLLNYLHYVASMKFYPYSEKDIEILYLAMLQLIKNRKLNLVALMQNTLRKIVISNNGDIQTKNQQTIQRIFLQNRMEMFDFLNQCISNYTTFSPIYESTLNYFNGNGQKSICWAVSSYISTLRFIISLCKSLDLKFKQTFSQSQSLKKQFIGELIELNRRHIVELFKDTSDAKLTIIAYEIELINNLMRGPVKTNIQIALKFKFQDIISLIKLPDHHDDPARISTFKIIVHIKKLVAEAALILAPFHKFNKDQIQRIQEGFIVYYKSTGKLSNDDLDSVINRYTQEYKNQIDVMNFDLALNLFFCLIKIYEKQQNLTIKRLRTNTLQKIRQVKDYNKRFKMFYQIYRILADVVGSIARAFYRCGRRTAIQLDQVIDLIGDAEISHEEKLKEGFKFFVKNVSGVEIQIGEQIQPVHFLLMKQTRCYNNSIRKQLHRNVGLGDRDYRMTKFMEQTDHVILRLQIEKKIKTLTEKYKPIQIIIKNRQLWKSLNFFCACLLNLVFLDAEYIQYANAAMYVLRALVILFCMFLFIIYFIQNLPLKQRLAMQMAKSNKPQKFKKIKSCLQIFNDKTLWFATIYLTIILLSIYQEGFVAVLMIDFFVRFKISKQVTQIITRPIVQLLIIVLISVQIAYVFTFYTYFIKQNPPCANTATCIQSTYFEYLGLNKNTVSSDSSNTLKTRNIVQFFATFFTIMINNSLIIAVLLYEKKAKDTKKREWQFKVKQKCFICDEERNIVDRARNSNKGFFEHIEEEHNLWSYIFYLIYLKNKQVESLNVVESLVLAQWKQKNINWLPRKFVA